MNHAFDQQEQQQQQQNACGDGASSCTEDIAAAKYHSTSASPSSRKRRHYQLMSVPTRTRATRHGRQNWDSNGSSETLLIASHPPESNNDRPITIPESGHATTTTSHVTMCIHKPPSLPPENWNWQTQNSNFAESSEGAHRSDVSSSEETSIPPSKPPLLPSEPNTFCNQPKVHWQRYRSSGEIDDSVHRGDNLSQSTVPRSEAGMATPQPTKMATRSSSSRRKSLRLQHRSFVVASSESTENLKSSLRRELDSSKGDHVAGRLHTTVLKNQRACFCGEEDPETPTCTKNPSSVSSISSERRKSLRILSRCPSSAESTTLQCHFQSRAMMMKPIAEVGEELDVESSGSYRSDEKGYDCSTFDTTPQPSKLRLDNSGKASTSSSSSRRKSARLLTKSSPNDLAILNCTRSQNSTSRAVQKTSFCGQEEPESTSCKNPSSISSKSSERRKSLRNLSTCPSSAESTTSSECPFQSIVMMKPIPEVGEDLDVESAENYKSDEQNNYCSTFDATPQPSKLEWDSSEEVFASSSSSRRKSLRLLAKTFPNDVARSHNSTSLAEDRNICSQEPETPSCKNPSFSSSSSNKRRRSGRIFSRRPSSPASTTSKCHFESKAIMKTIPEIGEELDSEITDNTSLYRCPAVFQSASGKVEDSRVSSSPASMPGENFEAQTTPLTKKPSSFTASEAKSQRLKIQSQKNTVSFVEAAPLCNRETCHTQANGILLSSQVKASALDSYACWVVDTGTIPNASPNYENQPPSMGSVVSLGPRNQTFYNAGTESPHSPTSTDSSRLKMTELNEEVKRTFGEVLEDMATPCLSSRIFAAFLLSAEKRGLTRRALDESCILPFLRSLVKAEAVSLRGWVLDQPKSVDFCGFDYSSTFPPVDRVQGSGTNQEDCIAALLCAKREVESLFSPRRNKNERSGIRAFLSELHDFLSSPCPEWLKLCAKSVESSMKRVERAAENYSEEINVMLSRNDGYDKNLFLEKRMADFVGLALRYQLRLLLRPAPPRLTPADADYANWSQRHSQVHNKIVMKMERKGAVDVDDDRLAALFNSALDSLCGYFGLDKLTDPTFSEPILPQHFFQRPASQCRFEQKDGPRLSNEDLKEVLADIEEATHLVSAKNASSFLYDLLSLPTVQEEIERQGGWSSVETYATYSRMYNLWKLCPEDEHLVALCNFDSFFRRLDGIVRALDGPSHHALKSLESFKKRFNLKAKSKRLLKERPEVVKVAIYLAEISAGVTVFPSISEA
ncbi:hypothetical protein ACA910_005948 [Epithemia clementina (nom. ined.)]